MDKQVYFGAEVKALDASGKVGGYLVRFGSANETDVEGDYFDRETDFYGKLDGQSVPILYHHGLDKKLGKRQLAEGDLRVDDAGVWVEAQLQLRDAYEQRIFKLAQAGKLGWSSGAVAHMVERQRNGNAQHITKWKIGEGSLTPMPAEPRAQAYALKALEELAIAVEVEPGEQAETAPEAAPAAVAVANAPTDQPEAVKHTAPDTAQEVNTEQPKKEGNATMFEIDAKQLAEAVETAAKSAVQPINDKVTQMQNLMMQLTADPALVAVPGATKSDSDKEQETKQAFAQYLRGQTATPEYRELKAALNEGTSSQGGYLVPTVYSGEIVKARTAASILRQAGARVIRVSGTNSYKVPTQTDSSAAVKTAEGAAFDQAEPTFGQVTFTPIKYTKLVLVSDEMMADSKFPIESLVMEDAGRAFAGAENINFTTGDGTGDPQGVVTGSSLGVTAAATAAITADEIFDLQHALGYLYRQNSAWMMHDSTFKAIRKLKDSNDQYLWQPGLSNGAAPTLLGRPVFINNSMDELAAGKKVIVYGDFSYYWIVDWMEMEMKRLAELYAANGQVGYRFYSRFDGRVMLSAAIKHLITAAS